MLSAADPGLRRVSIHSGTAVVDVALPAADARRHPDPVDRRHRGRPRRRRSNDLTARRYQLSLPARPRCDASTTLAQNGIRDGAVLVLSQSRDTAARSPLRRRGRGHVGDARRPRRRPTPGHQRLGSTGAMAASCLTVIGTLALIRNAFNANANRHIGATAGVAALAGLVALMFAMFAHRTYRDPVAGLTLSVIATTFGAVTGFLAVPGDPGSPKYCWPRWRRSSPRCWRCALSGCGAVTLTAVACFAIDHRYRRTGGCDDRAPRCARSVRYPPWYHLACWGQRRGCRSCSPGCPPAGDTRNWMRRAARRRLVSQGDSG